MINIFKYLVELIIIFLLISSLKKIIKKRFIQFKNNTSKSSIRYYLNNYLKNVKNNNEYFKIVNFKYSFSFKFNIIKIEYKFGFYEENNILVYPSDLVLYKLLNITCYIEILNNNISINTLPNIYQNNYYKCIEYYNINEKLKFGIKIYQIKETDGKIEDFSIFFINEVMININNLFYKNDKLYEPFIINKEYESLIKKSNDKKINETLKLKQSYLRYPFFILKRRSLNDNIWSYSKIYNDYFCYCKGLFCLNSKTIQKCKYYFYLNIIDNNRLVYNKTDYLFIDFIFSELSSDDAFPVFKKMFYQGLPVHYITGNEKIFNEFCYKNNEYLSVIYVNKDNYTINGDFLEKHLTLILKLKSVISGGGIYYNYINNLFYNIEYITYISITHGVCYFKYFLYKDYACYGNKRIDKILLPSDKIIKIAKNYGWKEKDIIKLNLPKWYQYEETNKFFNNKDKYKRT